MVKIRAIIICKSIHHGNTRKVAKAMAEVLGSKVLTPEEVNKDSLAKYHLIGFGSGIYFGKHHRGILDLVDKLPLMKNKRAFIFSTSGRRETLFHRFNRPLRDKLRKKGFEVVGEFSCRGWDTMGPLKLIGGIHKGRPNERDLQQAAGFAKDLLSTWKSSLS